MPTFLLPPPPLHPPQITDEAKAKLVEAYVSLRRGDAAPGSRTSYRITVRQLEALVRLSEALARLYCSSKVVTFKAGALKVGGVAVAALQGTAPHGTSLRGAAIAVALPSPLLKPLQLSCDESVPWIYGLR